MGEAHAKSLSIFSALAEVAQAALGGKSDSGKPTKDLSGLPPEIMAAQVNKMLSMGG